MANIRLTRIKASDSTTIKAQFTHELNPFLTTSNISITSITPGVPDPEVLKIKIVKDVLIIKTRPLTPYAAYFVEFKSVNGSQFKSKNGDAFLFEDGKTNIPLINGPEDPADSIRDNLIGYLKDNIYNFDDRTVVRDVVNSQAINLSKALHDIGQLKNDNYLEVLIENERKVRGKGPYDRLNEEGAFEIVRVGLKESGTFLSTSFNFDSFPNDPITLQRTDVSNEELTAGTGIGTFNGLILTVEKSPVTILKKVRVVYQSGGTAEYDISTLGYQIQNSRYDSSFGSTFLTLEDNQFKLNEDILENTSDFIPPASGDKVFVDYEYKSIGRIVDESSVIVSQVLDATRELVPAILTEFSLQHAPVVTSSDNIAEVGGIEFLDPLSNPPFSDTHPAFLKEIPFRLEGLPSAPGEYSVDYENGRVFVYGASTNDGTGNFPPVATYNYRHSFNTRLDYTYNPETLELVANPLRELIGEEVKVSFDYEQVLVPETDYVAQIHQESLNERIENRLNSLGSLKVKNTPITNVFRVYNETSGEIYTINRFNDHSVFFSYNTAPRILIATRERVQFTDVLNELLLIDNELVNSSSVRIFRIPLQNNNIINGTEDAIATSYNTSASFSRIDIFETEIYFDGQTSTISQNTDKLTVGKYLIDYINGVVYVGVSNTQTKDIGTINYKSPIISPKNSHVLSVSNVYHSISHLQGVNKTINYIDFDEGKITPESFDYSDERFLNNDNTLPYVVDSDEIEVANDIKTVRGVYDLSDLNNNIIPTNFGSNASVSANVITLATNGVQKKESLVIQAGNTIDVTFISSGAEICDVISVRRISDNAELWDNSGSFSDYTITLSGTNSPIPGEEVLAIYNVKLNGSATPVVDYNRGDYFADYNYLADEILVSYEYGDNVIDFRESGALDEDDEYFVTYKVGALRDALLKNFGTLVDIPILNSFDISLSRELYRDALQAALQSFTKGPTIPALKQIASNITKIDPEIIESIFEIWSLSVSYLYPKEIETAGELELISGKFDNGVLITNSDETITFPVSSNLRLEDGTLAMWVIPEWDGLDNDATLTFSSLVKDGYSLEESEIFIGADSHNPTFDLDGNFEINKTDENSPIGLPSAIYTQAGLFIYYDDVNKRWNVLAKSSISSSSVFSGQIFSSGEVYDVKFIENLGELGDVLRSYTNKIEFTFNLDGYDQSSPDGYDGYDGYVSGYSFDGITFMADDLHYFFDFGKDEHTERFSLYKDGKGYLNFEVWDKGNKKKNRKNSFKISADISDWASGEKHLIGCSWRLNSPDRRDEMHLFVDGFEVPNILRYGGRPTASSTDRFRTVKPEIVAGTLTKKTILGNDLETTEGSNVVSSATINFQTEGIIVGDSIDIMELGFGDFTINTVSGNTLTLNSAMPASLSDARFSVNKFSTVVSSEIDLASNISVSILSGGEETELPGLRASLPAYEVSKNALNQNVLTLLGNADVGDQIVIRTYGLNHRRCRERVYVWGDTTSVLKTQMPPPINLDEAKIFRVIKPLTVIGPENATLVGSDFQATFDVDQPTNSVDGRTLSIRMTDGNITFSTPATVTLNGTTFSGAISETVVFTEAATKNTTEKWRTISSINVQMTPVVSSKNSASFEIKETYQITEDEGNTTYPVIRFSFKTQNGITLEGDGSDVVSDENGLFTDSDIGNKLVISSPGSVAGTYTITERLDENTIKLSPTPAMSFTNGIYDIYNVSIGRSGFQNGFFTLETAGQTNVAFPLPQGYYDFDYSSYLEVTFNPLSNINAYVGSDLNGTNQAKSIIDEFRILSNQLTDVRIGETIEDNEKSFTTDYTALREFEPDKNTLMLLRFNNFPFKNEALFYQNSIKEFVQSGESVNSNFNQSIVITNKPLVYENKGFLSTTSEGTIEFWVSPRFDTYNDPNYRFYFDASGSIIEETVSLTNGTVKINGTISEVISVRLATDTNNTGTNYFAAGSINNDFQTIKLGKALPSQQTPVKVAYIPSGLSGDRISIYKDREGFITFNVRASGIDYQVRQPVFWSRDSWHRIRATYKFNSSDNQDEIRLFVDGEERGMILFGAGLIFGTAGAIFGQGLAGLETTRLIDDINFNDPINNIYIGSDYLSANTAQARFDNFKISNIIQSPILIAGQSKDLNYSSNLSTVYPVIPDAFTTFLLDFNQLIQKVDDFAILRNEQFGIFNFTMNIIDSFGIVVNNAKIKQVLENLIYALKPAQSKVLINLIQ